jgi:diketogulonate reductase-like aldo/keto reductase
MSVIIGAKTPEQLADNIAAADLVLSEDDLAILEKASALRPEYPRWMVDRQNSARVPQPFAKAG